MFWEIIKKIGRKPDDISQEFYASGLKISRTPIRDALSKLEEDHFIEKTEKGGCQVCRISLKDYMDFFEFRICIECRAAYLAARSASDEHVIALMFFASLMEDSLKASGILATLEDLLMKVSRSTTSLVASTLIYAYGIVMLTGDQMLGIIIPGKTMGDIYDKMNVSRKVLSRSLEDSATIGSAIIPWCSGAAYITSVLGCGLGYIPYAFLCYIVPVFSILCAMAGIGIWRADGSPVWKKDEKKEGAVAEGIG